MESKDLIIAEIQNAVSKILGDSAGVVMRRAGMSASKKIWPELPSGKTPEEAGVIMSNAVRELGTWGDFRITGVEDGVIKIEFKDCYFADLTGESGKPCGEQPICFFGFGLVEETLKRLTGMSTKVELSQRDEGAKTCFETATPRRGPSE